MDSILNNLKLNKNVKIVYLAAITTHSYYKLALFKTLPRYSNVKMTSECKIRACDSHTWAEHF